jgi:squalene cyclase
MKLSELKRLVERYDLNTYHEDSEVVIQIKLPYSTVGGSPFVKVKNVYPGFDWDQGKFFIIPEEDVTPSDRDFAKQMQEMQERAGWADYENRNLKAEIRQLKKKLKAEDEPKKPE